MSNEGDDSAWRVSTRPPKGHPIYDEGNLGREVGEWYRDYLAASGQDLSRTWVIPVSEVALRGTRYYVSLEGIVFKEWGGAYQLVSLDAFEDEEKDPTLPVFERVVRKIKVGLATPRTIVLTRDEFRVE